MTEVFSNNWTMEPLTVEDAKRKDETWWKKNIIALLSMTVSLIAVIIAIVAFIQTKPSSGSPPPTSPLPRIGNSDNLRIANNSDQILKNSASIENVILGLQAMKNESQHLQGALESIEANVKILEQKQTKILDGIEKSQTSNRTMELLRKNAENLKQNLTQKITKGLEALRNETSKLEQNLNGFLTWPWPYNGYIYSRTTQQQSWAESRRACQAINADLAVVGIKDYVTRVSIGTAMRLGKVWVGVSDEGNEGNWTWIDGTLGSASDIVWSVNQPDNYNDGEHCGEIWPDYHDYKMNDGPCGGSIFGLCEKRFTP